MRAYVDGDRIHVESGFDHRLALKALPGARWAPITKTWHIPASPAAADALYRGFVAKGLTLTPDVFTLVQQADAQRAAVAFKDAEDLPEIPGKTPAWLHQKQAFHFISGMPSAMLAMDMGTGKTRTAIARLEQDECMLVVIVCPKSVMRVWPGQFEQHADRRWKVIVADPKLTVQRRAHNIAIEMQRHIDTGGGPIAIIVNYDAVWRGPMVQLLRRMDLDAFVMDESHRIKSAGGKASLFCARLSKQAKLRLALTGTPMPHSPLDLYAQFRALDPGIFGTSANRFKHRYAIMGGYENRQVVGWQNEEELATKFGSISYVCRKDEVLDLPPYQHIERFADLTPRAGALYAKLERDLVADIDGGTVTAQNALTRLLRLQQCTSGFAKTDTDEEVKINGEKWSEKQELLADVLEDIGREEPIIIFCRFQHDLDAVREVCEANRRRCGELSGRIHELTDDARMRPEHDALIVQIQAGGVGIDLTRARYAIYYSLGFSLGDYEQSLARVHRPGQTLPTYYVHLLAKGTVDEKVYKALRQRKRVVDAVVEASRS